VGKGWALLSDSFHRHRSRPLRDIGARSFKPAARSAMKNALCKQIKSLPTPTAAVLIDISPKHPDCTGGHQIIVKAK
jgi:hypothetical protein